MQQPPHAPMPGPAEPDVAEPYSPSEHGGTTVAGNGAYAETNAPYETEPSPGYLNGYSYTRDAVEPWVTHRGLDEADPWDPETLGWGAPPRQPHGLALLWPWGWQGVAETLEVVALAIIMFVGVRAIGQNWVVVGPSMEPTFQNGNLLIVNKLSYQSFDFSWLPGVGSDDWRPFGQPEVGDVVVFHFPQDPDRDFIKRIIATPGQTVEITTGDVYVDGHRLDEPYIFEPPNYEYPATVVPEGHVFVLGDNRNNSSDSHYWGMLSKDLIVGKPELRYWPPSEFGRIDHYRQNGLDTVGTDRPAPGVGSASPSSATVEREAAPSGAAGVVASP